MDRIYLVRHGIAVPHGTPGVPEDERPLTPEGELEMFKIASGLKRLRVKPDRIVTSPLPRARRTAQIIAGVLGREDRLEVAEVLSSGSPPATIMDWLGTREESRIMLVGHNPDFTELLGLLLGLSENQICFELKKGGVAALTGDIRGRYGLHWLSTPKLFRTLID